MSDAPVHVLVVDDSAVMRESMTALLTSTGGFSSPNVLRDCPC